MPEQGVENQAGQGQRHDGFREPTLLPSTPTAPRGMAKTDIIAHRNQ